MSIKREYAATAMGANADNSPTSTQPASSESSHNGPDVKRVKQSAASGVGSPASGNNRRKSFGAGAKNSGKRKLLKVKLYKYVTNKQLALVLESAERAVNTDKYDVDAWQHIMSYVTTVTPINDAIRRTYETFLSIFPTASKYWKFYCRAEIDAGRYDLVEKLFVRCLGRCPDPELWHVYVTYIQRTKAGQPDELTAVTEAYEYALRHVGEDVFSSPVWQSYVEFLQKMAAAPTPTPAEKQARIEALRAVLQRAVVSPIENCDALWKAYDAFEHSVNAANARAMIAPLVSKHFAANTFAAQRRANKQKVPLHALARPLRAQAPGKPIDLSAFNAWRQYIIYEAGNPGRATAPVLRARTILAFEQASLVLQHYPEFWMLYVTYLRQCIKDNSTSASGLIKIKQDQEAIQALFRRALEAMPYSVLMRLVYANYLEENRQIAEAKAVYESLLVTERRQKEQESSTSLSTSVTSGAQQDDGESESSDESDFETENTANDATSSQDGNEEDPSEVEDEKESGEDRRRRGLGFSEGEGGDEITETHPIAYIQYMRFVRRTEGRDEARRIFVMARRSPSITWHVYIAAAQMELVCNQDPGMAVKILAFGLKEFGHEPGYVLEHINLLMVANDHANLKLLFETVLSSGSFGPDRHPAAWLQIWNKYVEFTRDSGEGLVGLGKLQLRRNVALGIPPVPVPGVGALTALDAPSSNQPQVGQDRRERALAAQQQVIQSGGAAAITKTDDDAELHRLSVWEMLERFNFLDLTPCSSVYSETQARQRAMQLKASAGSASAELDQALAGLGGVDDTSMVNGMVILRNLPTKKAQQAKLRFPRPNLSLLTELTPTLAKTTSFPSSIIAKYGHSATTITETPTGLQSRSDMGVPFASPAFAPPGAPHAGFDVIAAFLNTLPHEIPPPRFSPLFSRFLHMLPQPPYCGPPLDLDTIIRVMRVGPPLPPPRAAMLRPEAIDQALWAVRTLDNMHAASTAGPAARPPAGVAVPPHQPGSAPPPHANLQLQQSWSGGPRGATVPPNPAIPRR